MHRNLLNNFIQILEMKEKDNYAIVKSDRAVSNKPGSGRYHCVWFTVIID